MTAEAYSVAVKVSLLNHVSSGLMMISKHLAATGSDADKLNAKLSSIGKQAAIGAAMFGGGMAIAALLKAPLEEAKKLAQAKADFSTLNLSAADNEKVFSAASMNAHKNLGMSITDNIKLIQDLHTAMGNLPHALENAPAFSQFSIAARIRNGGKEVDGLVMNAAKALEHRGDKVMMHPEEFQDELSRMSKVYFGSKGRVDPNEYYRASKTGGMSYSLLDKEFLYGQFAGFMSTQSGDSAGTSLMTAFSSLVGGHMDNKAKGFLAKLGLLQVGVSPEQVKLTKEAIAKLHLPEKDAKKMLGAMMPVTGGLSDKYLSMYASRPDLFSSQVLVPAIRRVFGKDLSNEQVAEIEAKYFNRGTSKLLGPLVLSGSKLEKDSEIFGKSMGFGQAYQMYRKSPEGAELAAGEAWKNFLALVGSVYLPIVTKGLEKLAYWLDVAGQYVEKNPEQIKKMVGALALFSGFLIGGGVLNMVIAAGRGFWLVGQALWFVGATVMGPMLPILARFGTYMVMFAVDFARFVMSFGFIRGFLMAFLSPVKLIGQALYFMIAPLGLLLTPVGIVFMGLAAAALLIWNNWAEIKGALFKSWDAIKDGVIKLFHGDIGGAFKSFAYVFLLGWQTIFNTLIAGANQILPASMQISKTSFADDYKNPGGLVAPVPKKDFSKDPVVVHINLDGKKVGEAMIQNMAREAAKPQTGIQGFDPSRSMLMPGTPSAAYPR